MAQLAIKGHPTRSKEISALIKMLGGKISSLPNNFKCNNPSRFYYVLDGYICWDYIGPEEINDFTIYTLEDFLEKYPYKVGDFVSIPEYESEVRICEMQWGGFEIQYKVYRVDEKEWYTSDELLDYNDNLNKMIKDMDEKDKAKATPEITTLNMSAIDYNNGLVGYEIPVGYEFDTVCNGEIILKPKKPTYPKTYGECCECLSLGKDGKLYTKGYKASLIQNFQKLLICRYAYWKIAGEQMGLDRPWGPDWADEIEGYYTISYDGVNIKCYNDTDVYSKLAFLTKEMRDTFYENFKELIEDCKELL